MPLHPRASDHRIAVRCRTTVSRAWWVAFAVATGAVACRKSETDRAIETKSASGAPAVAETKSATPAVPEPVRKVLGRWMRADGGYVLELRGAEISGVLEAAYFNPKPIRVSRAIWMQDGGGFKIAVELNDVGYPGATYLLTHQAASDRLVGTYTQPAMQQSFDIEFVRQPPR
jgi:hypothetical protein